MAKVFISYASTDPAASGLARLIHNRLAEAGIESFLDLSKIAPGRAIDAAIRRVLPTVETVVMVVSASSVDSKWMMAECVYAFENNVAVIPVLAEPGAKVPFPFNRLLRLDLCNRFEEEWPRLIELLAQTAPTETAPTNENTPEKAGRFVQLIVVLGIVVVVVPFGWTKYVELGTVTTTPRSLTLPDLVEIPGGVFMMGSEQGDDDETPVRAVTIEAPFYLSATEITFEQYDAFAAATKSKIPDAGAWGRGDRPVINVSWDEATAYARWLDAMTGSGCRLPSDTEWEYAARAGTETRFALRHSIDDPWGTDDLAGLANCRDCGSSPSLTDEEDRLIGERTMLVGLFGSNEFGLRDMHGNVWEWVESCYDKVADDTACQRRVLRGGSWYDFQNYARSANRSFNDPYDRINFVGFRVLCSSPIP